MRKPKIAVKVHEGEIAEFARGVEHKALATWALDCAERVLGYFEERYPHDGRPRAAIETGREWVRTGVFRMAVIRKASLDAHAAARAVETDDVARSVARAAGQAVATAHVRTHALGAAAYAATVVRDLTDSNEAVEKERQWQYRHLVKISEEQR